MSKKTTTKNLNKYHCLEVTQKKFVVKALCSSEITIHQLKILHVDTLKNSKKKKSSEWHWYASFVVVVTRHGKCNI